MAHFEKQSITVKKIQRGKYEVTRADGMVFTVSKSHNLMWIIESQQTYNLTHADSLKGAKFDISQGWSAVTRGER